MKISKTELKLNRIVLALCAILFLAFSFCFLAFYQNGLLEALHNLLSDGKTTYMNYLTAAIVTLLLFLVRCLYNRLAHFHGYWEAFSYLPSCLLLAFVTDIDRTIYYQYDATHWLWILLGSVVFSTLLIWLCRRLLPPVIKNVGSVVYRVLSVNMLVLALLFCMTGMLSGSNENFHHEVSIYRLTKEGKIDDALRIGENSLDSSHELAAVRAFALSKAGQMGERLFEYPQYFGADGLLLNSMAVRTTILSPNELYNYLGLQPHAQESAISFLQRAVAVDTLNMLKDYYLSALLLDKQLDLFVEVLPQYYDNSDTLPKHFDEALILYQWLNSGTVSADNFLAERFNDFLTLQSQYEDATARNNYARRKFGKTYWWYYIFGGQKKE